MLIRKSAKLVHMEQIVYRNRASLYLLAAIVFLAQLSACSSSPVKQPPQAAPQANSTRITYEGDTLSRLDKHFAAWRGTPYRMGGLNKQGIDCSGFVYITYRDVFGVSLPRTTRQLAKTGTEIPKGQLKTGDLVIFKTGLKQKHVGVYIGNGKFLHASSSKGVIASNMHSDYWSDAFRQSRRVLQL